MQLKIILIKKILGFKNNLKISVNIELPYLILNLI